MLTRGFRLGVLCVLGITALVACSDLGDPPTDPEVEKEDSPIITAVVPDSGAVGDTVRVEGENFGSNAGSAMLGSLSMTVASWSDQVVRLVVPEGAVTGMIRLQSSAGASNSVPFRVRRGDGGGGGVLPVIEEIVPLRTVAGDTLWMAGTGFGSEPGDWSIEFAETGGRVAAAILSWTDTEVMVEVPASAVSGEVTVTDGEQTTAGFAFEVAPRLISFSGDLLNSARTQGIFAANGCSSCHFDRQSGNNGFSVANPTDIRSGGNHGPAAIPRRAHQSLVIRVLKGIEPGIERMPQGGEMPAAQLSVVEDWINQGMRDN